MNDTLNRKVNNNTKSYKIEIKQITGEPELDRTSNLHSLLPAYWESKDDGAGREENISSKMYEFFWFPWNRNHET